MKNKNWLVAATLLAGLAVIFGAFGAHSLKTLVSPIQIETFKTGVQYHFYHALAIALAVLITQFIDNQNIQRSFAMFSMGILCFSGSLYGFTLAEAVGTEGVRWLGLVTPLGGMFFILGWFNLSIGVYKSKA
jgi:uncharacterized membrane protein YgdD (TMEM256/DUF423 family)